MSVWKKGLADIDDDGRDFQHELDAPLGLYRCQFCCDDYNREDVQASMNGYACKKCISMARQASLSAKMCSESVQQDREAQETEMKHSTARRLLEFMTEKLDGTEEVFTWEPCLKFAIPEVGSKIMVDGEEHTITYADSHMIKHEPVNPPTNVKVTSPETEHNGAVSEEDENWTDMVERKLKKQKKRINELERSYSDHLAGFSKVVDGFTNFVENQLDRTLKLEAEVIRLKRWAKED